MIKWLLLIAASLMAGCNSTDPKSAPSLSGTYENTLTATNGIVVTQWIFSSGNTYEGKVYVAADNGSMHCLLGEAAGEWTITADALKLAGVKRRSRSDCDSALSAWTDGSAKSDPIRNLTSSSFELYLAADENSPAQWLTFVKL